MLRTPTEWIEKTEFTFEALKSGFLNVNADTYHEIMKKPTVRKRQITSDFFHTCGLESKDVNVFLRPLMANQDITLTIPDTEEADNESSDEEEAVSE